MKLLLFVAVMLTACVSKPVAKQIPNEPVRPSKMSGFYLSQKRPVVLNDTIINGAKISGKFDVQGDYMISGYVVDYATFWLWVSLDTPEALKHYMDSVAKPFFIDHGKNIMYGDSIWNADSLRRANKYTTAQWQQIVKDLKANSLLDE